MSVSVSSLVLFATDPVATAAFYRALGVPLEGEDDGDGVEHLAADVGGVHVAVLAATGEGRAPARQAGGSTFAGFYVPDLDAARTSAAALGAPVLVEHAEMPWGCRSVLEDPDGRMVEVNQRSHC